MKTIGIFGTSGFAREVSDIALDLGFRTVFIARDSSTAATWTFQDKIILEEDLENHKDMYYCIGVGENQIRQKIAEKYRSKLTFINLIHPSASFGRDQRQFIESREGIIVCAGTRFTNNIKVGDFSIFNLNATIGHDVIVGDYVNIAPGVNVSGNVHIETRCWIGTGSAINQGTPDAKLIIGHDTMIGSGAVVVKNCDPGAVYVGIPAKRIK